ncbi:MAG TPA: ABC transporter ATP-binding protein [Solirubrobacteraceae bacterium]|jgi:oligopeptide/dipeptide ABC transporter ATP-binding protein|nr:ABC transporter ATP-binding protein [Solirubrobacteraceae bacterium]
MSEMPHMQTETTSTDLPTATGEAPILAVEGLRVEFSSDQGVVRAATNVRFSVPHGRTLGIVGESGCGKSVTLRALCGLVPEPGRIVAGTVEVEGVRYHSGKELASLRGEKLSMIFQDPASSLNPVHTIGAQVSEVLRVKLGHSRRVARAEAIDLLGHVGIPEPARRMAAYPHELSGGMRQRVMIAMAIACRPRVLLADEPTTALDVTTQEQILKLLLRLQDESGMAIVLVTHDLGVIEEFCDEVAVMYAGYVVERGSIEELVSSPKHPYTRGLMAAMPQIDAKSLPEVIVGQPPDLATLLPGCPYAPRCPQVREECPQVDMEAMTVTRCACPFVGPSGEEAAILGVASREDEKAGL